VGDIPRWPIGWWLVCRRNPGSEVSKTKTKEIGALSILGVFKFVHSTGFAPKQVPEILQVTKKMTTNLMRGIDRDTVSRKWMEMMAPSGCRCRGWRETKHTQVEETARFAGALSETLFKTVKTNRTAPESFS
jgi:hypothetical protein